MAFSESSGEPFMLKIYLSYNFMIFPWTNETQERKAAMDKKEVQYYSTPHSNVAKRKEKREKKYFQYAHWILIKGINMKQSPHNHLMWFSFSPHTTFFPPHFVFCFLLAPILFSAKKKRIMKIYCITEGKKKKN
jgi:hypothetical protein